MNQLQNTYENIKNCCEKDPSQWDKELIIRSFKIKKKNECSVNFLAIFPTHFFEN